MLSSLTIPDGQPRDLAFHPEHSASTHNLPKVFPFFFDLRLDSRYSQVLTNYWVNTDTTTHDAKTAINDSNVKNKNQQQKNKQKTKVIWGGVAYKVMNTVMVRSSVEGGIQGRNLRMRLMWAGTYLSLLAVSLYVTASILPITVYGSCHCPTNLRQRPTSVLVRTASLDHWPHSLIIDFIDSHL